MSQYAAVAQRSLAAISKKGGPVAFPDAGTPEVFDPATNTWSGGTDSSNVGRAVQIEGDPDRFAALKLVLTNPVTLMIAAAGLSVTPVPGMAFTWAGVSYVVRDVESVAPDGTPIIYIVTGSA